MTINFTLDKRVREDIEPLTLKIEYREGIPLVNVAQLMRLFNWKPCQLLTILYLKITLTKFY